MSYGTLITIKDALLLNKNSFSTQNELFVKFYSSKMIQEGQNISDHKFHWFLFKTRPDTLIDNGRLLWRVSCHIFEVAKSWVKLKFKSIFHFFLSFSLLTFKEVNKLLLTHLKRMRKKRKTIRKWPLSWIYCGRRKGCKFSSSRQFSRKRLFLT